MQAASTWPTAFPSPALLASIQRHACLAHSVSNGSSHTLGHCASQLRAGGEERRDITAGSIVAAAANGDAACSNRAAAAGPGALHAALGGRTHSPGQMGSPGAACAAASSAIRRAAARSRALMGAKTNVLPSNRLQQQDQGEGGAHVWQAEGGRAAAGGGASRAVASSCSVLRAACTLTQRPAGRRQTHLRAARGAFGSCGPCGGRGDVDSVDPGVAEVGESGGRAGDVRSWAERRGAGAPRAQRTVGPGVAASARQSGAGKVGRRMSPCSVYLGRRGCAVSLPSSVLT